jgi:serine/threonine protein phosphatase PrpC
MPVRTEESGFVEYIDPEELGKSRIHMCGRFDYTRENDRTVETFQTRMGEVTVGMWLGGKHKVQQQDAAFVSEDGDGSLWLAIADGLGGHPGGAEASQICCDVLREEIESGKPKIDEFFRNKIRLLMAKDRVIMKNPKKTGGSCICIVHINTLNHKLHAYSMGDVEVSVFRRGVKVVMANLLDSGTTTSGVTKVITPTFKAKFTFSEVWLEPADRVFVHSDGLTNKAFRGFSERKIPIVDQMNHVIDISEQENGPFGDNMSIICLERFLPATRAVFHPEVSDEDVDMI